MGTLIANPGAVDSLNSNGFDEMGIVSTIGDTRTITLNNQYTVMDAVFIQVISSIYTGFYGISIPITFTAPSTLSFQIKKDDGSLAGYEYYVSYAFKGH